MNDHPAVRHAVDGIAGLAVVGTLMGYLSPAAAVLAIVWYCLQIYDWIVVKIKASNAPENNT